MLGGASTSRGTGRFAAFAAPAALAATALPAQACSGCGPLVQAIVFGPGFVGHLLALLWVPLLIGLLAAAVHGRFDPRDEGRAP